MAENKKYSGKLIPFYRDGKAEVADIGNDKNIPMTDQERNRRKATKLVRAFGEDASGLGPDDKDLPDLTPSNTKAKKMKTFKEMTEAVVPKVGDSVNTTNGKGKVKSVEPKIGGHKVSVEHPDGKTGEYFHSSRGSNFSDVKVIREAITLKMKSPSGNVDKFMDEYHNTTGAHPFDRHTRVHGDYATTEVSKDGDGVHLGDIRALKPNSGGGTHALTHLTSLADKHGVRISGIAKTYHPNKEYIKSSSRLLKWYKKHGFKSDGGSNEDGYYIHYHPKTQVKEGFTEPGNNAGLGNAGDGFPPTDLSNPTSMQYVTPPDRNTSSTTKNKVTKLVKTAVTINGK